MRNGTFIFTSIIHIFTLGEKINKHHSWNRKRWKPDLWTSCFRPADFQSNPSQSFLLFTSLQGCLFLGICLGNFLGSFLFLQAPRQSAPSPHPPCTWSSARSMVATVGRKMRRKRCENWPRKPDDSPDFVRRSSNTSESQEKCWPLIRTIELFSSS